MTRKPITRQVMKVNRLLLGWAVLGLVFNLATDLPYDWKDGVSLALGLIVVACCATVEVQYRHDRRDGRV
jgi:hypothetical protein